MEMAPMDKSASLGQNEASTPSVLPCPQSLARARDEQTLNSPVKHGRGANVSKDSRLNTVE